VRGITDRGQDSACSADKKTLETAYEMALANGFDLTTLTTAQTTDMSSVLVANGYLRAASQYYGVSSAGVVSVKTGVTKCS
jgi:hypothetical protein